MHFTDLGYVAGCSRSSGNLQPDTSAGAQGGVDSRLTADPIARTGRESCSTEAGSGIETVNLTQVRPAISTKNSLNGVIGSSAIRMELISYHLEPVRVRHIRVADDVQRINV